MSSQTEVMFPRHTGESEARTTESPLCSFDALVKVQSAVGSGDVSGAAHLYFWIKHKQEVTCKENISELKPLTFKVNH